MFDIYREITRTGIIYMAKTNLLSHGLQFRDKCDKVMWPLNYLSPRIFPSLPLPTKKKKKKKKFLGNSC